MKIKEFNGHSFKAEDDAGFIKFISDTFNFARIGWGNTISVLVKYKKF